VECELCKLTHDCNCGNKQDDILYQDVTVNIIKPDLIDKTEKEETP
jgi:hypothetical protein